MNFPALMKQEIMQKKNRVKEYHRYSEKQDQHSFYSTGKKCKFEEL